jgi:hypothetical protein
LNITSFTVIDVSIRSAERLFDELLLPISERENRSLQVIYPRQLLSNNHAFHTGSL